MSIKINTMFGEIVTSQALNEKIDTLFGENAIISGFDVARETDTSVRITPGKAIVCGASIEEDSDSIIIPIPGNLASLKEVYVVIEYMHDHKRVSFKITNSVESNMVLLATINMQGGLILKINNSQKTGQLNELSMIAKDLSTGILNTQHLAYSGNHITIKNSINAKTQNMNIKGVTKQNLVQSVNKEVCVSAEYQVEEATHHKLTDVKDGYLDLNIKGRMLKNACPLNSGWADRSNLISISGEVLTYTSQGDASAYGNFFSRLSAGQLKPSAEYTFVVRIISNSLVFSDDILPSKSIVFGGLDRFDSAFSQEYYLPTDASPGYYVFKLPTRSSFDNIRIANRGYVGRYCTGGSISFSYMIFEGDVSDAFLENIPYINGIESAVEKENNVIEIMSSGKNILPLEILRHEMASVDIANQTLAVSQTNPKAYSFCQKDITHLLKDGVTYTLSASYSDSTYGHYGIDCFDKLTKQRVHINVRTFTANLNLYYYTVKFYTNKTDQPVKGDISVTYSNIQLEEGGNPTPHETYKEHKLRYVLPEPLRSLPNGVCDEITADGMVVQRVGKVVFNGSEDWKVALNSDNITNRYDLNFDKFKRCDGLVDDVAPNMYCDRLSTKTFAQVYRGYEAGLTHCWSDNTPQTITIGLKDSKTLTEFKQWLSNNPITVYYELATPITYRLGSAVLPNDVKDSIYDNKIIQRVDSITFNGSESNWNLHSKREKSIIFTYMKDGVGPVLSGGNYPVTPAISNIIQSSNVDLAYPAKDIEGVYTSKDGRICVAINKDRINGIDVNSFKQWLSKNPLTVWYQLPEPKTISCNDPIRVRCYDNTTYIKTTNALAPKIKVDSKGHKYPVLLKPNTRYTVCLKSMSGDNNIKIDLGGTKIESSREQYMINIGTPTNLLHSNLYISGWNTETRDVMVQQQNNNSAYIEGISSSIAHITSTNNNLWNTNTLRDWNNSGMYFEGDDVLIDTSLSTTSLKAEESILKYNFKPNTQYHISYKYKQDTKAFRLKIAIRYTDGTYQVPANVQVLNELVKVENVSVQGKTIDYIYFTWNTQTGNNKVELRNIYVCELSEKTSYEKQQSYSANAALDEPLRSLPNNVCDEIVDGKLTRRVGEVVFDGSENWKYHSMVFNGQSARCILDVNNLKATSPVNRSHLICDKLVIGFDSPAFLDANNAVNSIFQRNDLSKAALYVTVKVSDCNINSNDSDSQKLTKIKAWLSDNPITVLYELSKPVITDINTDLNIRTFDDKTHIITEGLVKAELKFKAPANLRAVVNQVADRIAEAEKLVDELLLPNIVGVDYERTLLEFNYKVSKFNLEGDE